MEEFQDDVEIWLHRCFEPEIADNVRQRMQRFLEEALEFFQSKDMTKEDALALVDYVYSRKKGDPEQEVGGVMVTLAAACARMEIDLHLAAWSELQRIDDPKVIAKIRAKQDAKNNVLGISDEGKNEDG